MMECMPRLIDAGAKKFVAAIEQQIELKTKVKIVIVAAALLVFCPMNCNRFFKIPIYFPEMLK